MTDFTLGMLFTIVLIFVSISSGVWWISWRNGRALDPSKDKKCKKMKKKEKEKFLQEWASVSPDVEPKVDFTDSYKMEWLLRDANGLEFCEYFNDISLSDFEVIYGNNTHEIIMVELRLKYV